MESVAKMKKKIIKFLNSVLINDTTAGEMRTFIRDNYLICNLDIDFLEPDKLMIVIMSNLLIEFGEMDCSDCQNFERY